MGSLGIKDGIIEPSPSAPFGFTEVLFPESWLWKVGDAVTVSFIQCSNPGRGHFRRLIEAILEAGYSVEIPTPLGRMREIVQRNGFERTFQQDPFLCCDAEVWIKRPRSSTQGPAVKPGAGG